MSWLDFTATVFCALIGFGIVSMLLGMRSKEDEPIGHDPADEPLDPEGADNTGPRAWWEVLDVAEGSPVSEIRSAYREKMRQYHPDRVQGLGKEFGDLANLKAKELNRAYALAKRQRGFGNY